MVRYMANPNSKRHLGTRLPVGERGFDTSPLITDLKRVYSPEIDCRDLES